jgi:hypothetical protein
MVLIVGLAILLLVLFIVFFAFLARPVIVVYEYRVILDSRTNYRLYVLVDGQTVIADENKGFAWYGFTCTTQQVVINAYSDVPFNLTIRELSPSSWTLKNETLVTESHTYFTAGSLNPYY